MRLTILFLTLFFLILPLSGKDVTEQPAAKEKPPLAIPVDFSALLSDGKYEEFLRVEESFKPKGAAARAKRHLQKFVALYETGQYKKMETEGWSLPKRYVNSFFIKYLSMQAYFARKRFKQAELLNDELVASYPLAIYRDSASCMKADMALYRRKYDEAEKLFDECIPQLKDASMASYRLILAKEKGHSPKSRLLGKYIEYDRRYPYSPAVSLMRERFETLYTKYNLPSEKSPLFNEWLYAMKRNKMLKNILKKSWFDISEPPLALVSYLMKEERFTDAYELAKRGSEQCEDDGRQYKYGWQMYRALSKGSKPQEAGEHLLELAKQVKNTRRKQQALFFAALAFEEAGVYEKSRGLFEQLIYQKERSPYFLLSLHRLGMHYLIKGNEWYTATLWTNFLIDEDLSIRGQYGGQRLLNNMRNVTTILNRKNGFYALGGASPLVCDDFEKCETSAGFISYYDFLWHHLEQPSFSHSFMKGVFKSNRFEKWLASSKKSRADLLIQLKKDVRKLPRSVRNGEYGEMMIHCANSGLNSCIDFYFTALRDALHTAKKPPEELSEAADRFLHSGESAKIVLFSRVAASLLKLSERDADLVDHHFSRSKKNLSYGPHIDDDEELWMHLYPTPYKQTALEAAKLFGVPPALLFSIMRTETFYRPFLRSPVGAVGLMQIMPTTFEKIIALGGLSLDDPFNPRQSIQASAWYLGKLLKRFDNNPFLAAAAYNGGPHNVTKWLARYRGVPLWVFIESIPFRETRNYVKKVARYMELYSYLYEGQYYDLELQAPLNIKESPEVVGF